jgi:tetratricopeptide (TPR) repeat protein
MNYDKVPDLPEVPVKPAHRRVGVWLAGAGLLLAAGVAAWWLFGRAPAEETTGQKQLAVLITELEMRLESLRTQLAALPAETPPATRRTLLEEAVVRQNELLKLRVPPVPADLERLGEWQVQLDDTLARELNRQSRDLEAAAEELRRQKQPAAAAEKLQEALRLQRAVNGSMAARHLKSYGREALLQQRIGEVETAFARPAATVAVGPSEEGRQTGLFGPMQEAVQALDAVAAAHLRRRELFQAQQQFAPAGEKLEEAVRQFPQARNVDENLRERLNYLRRRATDLGAIQDQTYDLLLPRPGPGSAALMNAPVPQVLFSLVMNANPSRNAGRTRAVDSVTQTEALEFCRRLGWVMGTVVRLPTAEELRAALHDPAFKKTDAGLDEWIAGEGEDAATAPVLGRDGAVQAVPRTERLRTTGFRVVVEVDLLAGR